MQTAHENGLVFNLDKCSLKAESVMFFGCLYDKNGIKPDPTKMEAICAMPAPSCWHELQELIGMVTYLISFIWGLFDLQESLRALTKKDVWLNWTPSHEKQLNIMKQTISATATLMYFDYWQTCHSPGRWIQIGLGAAILQDDAPVVYASEALTDTECWWAYIKHEAQARLQRMMM